MDTLTTHCKHATPAVTGEDLLTTHTDYVNRHPSVLQTTSYNFTGTKTTKEMCAGIVKASKVFPKNPAQHYADLSMLSEQTEFLSVFNSVPGCPKQIECVRVDGATDEGPSHEEVKYWWAVRHLECKRLVTLVSSRSSGSSYLNRVELQNGCLALGHTNLFIPSTLGGSPYNPDTGLIDLDRVEKNLDMAASVYIERVNRCPCGETVIHLFKGDDSSSLQLQRKHLLVYLKGSKKKKNDLKTREPDLYSYFELVSEVQQRHEVCGLPSQYLYLLVCCFKNDCSHPLCQSGKESFSMQWFPNGPRVDMLPLPVPDPARPWGSTDCNVCSGFCAGHYLAPEDSLLAAPSQATEPPSTLLKEFFLSSSSEPSVSALEEIARKCLLPVSVFSCIIYLLIIFVPICE